MALNIPSIQVQNPNVVVANNLILLTVDTHIPGVRIVLIDGDSNGMVDAIRFEVSDPTDVVYYSLNFPTGPFLLWDGISDISITNSDFFVYFYGESLIGNQSDIKNHVLNFIALDAWGERLRSGSKLRIFKYDFINQVNTIEYVYDVFDLQSLYKTVFEVFQAIPVDDTYFYEVEAPTSAPSMGILREKSMPRNLYVDFSPIFVVTP
jgi:hypothetical protein